MSRKPVFAAPEEKDVKAMEFPLCSVPEAIEEIRAGRMLIITDDADRENEGDLTLAAEKVTPEAINFMAMHGRGLICLSMTEERCDELQLPPMVKNNTARLGTAFTESVDARHGISTGISAFDRAQTIKIAVDPETQPSDLVRPGHVFPLRARKGGVLVRTGQTEGSVDLARLAGLKPAAVICEILNDDGTMARTPELVEFGKQHNMKICSVASIIQYRRRTEKLVNRINTVDLPTDYGHFKLLVYENSIDKYHHLILQKGEVAGKENVLVRVQDECLTGELFRSNRCDCGRQLESALELIGKSECGVFLYMRQEGRGIGFLNKMRAYELQEEGLDTVEANLRLGFKPDQRDYGIGAQILTDVGLTTIRLLTNNPRKFRALHGYGLEIVERVPLIITPNEHNREYLRTKEEKLGHVFRKTSLSEMAEAGPK